MSYLDEVIKAEKERKSVEKKVKPTNADQNVEKFDKKLDFLDSLSAEQKQKFLQEAQYKMQAKQAEFNRAAEEHKADKLVESYAQKQHALNDKFKLATGNARAQFGASGLDSQGGSLSDVIGASTDAYNRDSQNLLSNQREDSWASYVNQVNYLNEQNAYNTMAKNTKRQLAFNQFGTILSGVPSIYGQGYKEGIWGGSQEGRANRANAWRNGGGMMG